MYICIVVSRDGQRPRAVPQTGCVAPASPISERRGVLQGWML